MFLKRNFPRVVFLGEDETSENLIRAKGERVVQIRGTVVNLKVLESEIGNFLCVVRYPGLPVGE